MRLRTLNTLLGLPTLFLGLATAASAQTFAIFDPPNASLTYCQSINARGDVTGSFEDVTQNNKQRGFVRDRNGNIMVFDAAPDASRTDAFSINAHGDVTGQLRQLITDKLRGFLRDRNGNITVFDAPNTSITNPISINAGGDVTGWFFDDENQKERGFVRDRSGNITVFDAAPDARNTVPYAINDSGDVTGYFVPASPPQPNVALQSRQERGFVRERNGNITVFDAAPDAVYTEAYSINDRGDVTGYFVPASPPGQEFVLLARPQHRGFVRDRNENITVFNAPNALRTFAYSINAAGDIAGVFLDESQNRKERGFVRDRNGNTAVFDVFDAPNAAGTLAVSINDAGDATGFFYDMNQNNQRGFVRWSENAPQGR